MTAFRFRLETLLKLRRAALDQQRAKLAEAYRAEAVLHQRRQDLDRQIAEAQQERRAAAKAGAVDVDGVLRAQRYELLLHAERRGLEEQAKKVAEAVEQQRLRVVEADREVKILEKLRERRLEDHRRGEQARETKQLDETAARTRREA